jgi:endonuclease-8
MPEGHTLHRIARRHRQALAGGPVTAWSPQGRFAEGAAVLDGRTLLNVEAHGKHLFYTWEGAPRLHVHLGLVAKFPTHGSPGPEPTPGTRLVLGNDESTAHLAGPMTCRLADPSEIDLVLASLGPDPIRSRRGRPAFLAGLARRNRPIAGELLDQRLIAGIGNVYRAELLFLSGIHPATPASDLEADEASRLWDLTVDELRAGVELGRIVTVRPADLGASRRSQLSADERLYVYHRDGLPCRRCGTEILVGEIGGRRTWWCPSCQDRR